MTHTMPPWTDKLTPLMKAGDTTVLSNGFPFRTDFRVLAEENFQFAKERVNAYDTLTDEVKRLREENEILRLQRDAKRSACGCISDDTNKELLAALELAKEYLREHGIRDEQIDNAIYKGNISC